MGGVGSLKSYSSFPNMFPFVGCVVEVRHFIRNPFLIVG